METKQAMIARRSNYDLTDKMTMTHNELEDLLAFALEKAPSGFNSQSSRIVLVSGAKHDELWDLVLAGVKREIGATPAFEKSRMKIAGLRKAAGTILFYEDESINDDLKTRFPLYQGNIHTWSEQSQGMLQYAVWTLLADAGMGASLQHYNELIAEPLKAAWNINSSWRLVGQMPFGVPLSLPAPKEKKPGRSRLIVIE